MQNVDMISISEILLVLIGLASLFCFRWFSRKVVRKPNQDRLARIGKASFLFQLASRLLDHA